MFKFECSNLNLLNTQSPHYYIMPGKKKQRGRKADMIARKEKHRSEDQGDGAKLHAWWHGQDVYWASRDQQQTRKAARQHDREAPFAEIGVVKSST